MACRILERSIGDGGLVSPHAIGVKKKIPIQTYGKKRIIFVVISDEIMLVVLSVMAPLMW
jgi:hypothetical protein